MINNLILILLPLGAILIGIIIGYFIRRQIAEAKITSAEEDAKRIIDEAEKQGESMKREALLEAKEDIHKQRKELEKESRERRADLQRQERKLEQKEESLDKNRKKVEQKEKELSQKEEELTERENKLDELYQQQLYELEKISGLTTQDAKEELLNRVEEEMSKEKAKMVKEAEQKAKEESTKKAREIITTAIQKCAVDHVAESTVSVVSLPSDEMKGRIIGREGRNIRTLETLTGIDLIIDDTPEAVILSGFDPIRREVARIALEKLVSDGRIHPARIEEMVEKANKEVEENIKEEGEKAVMEVGVHNLNPELIKLLGRLKFRSSYGQNVLQHSIEVCNLAIIMANEVGVDPKISKRAGLLHDIGKAVDHEMEGNHVAIGAELAKKYGEKPEVIHAIAAHHGDEEPESLSAVFVQTADAISAARPGARRETLEAYIKRLEKLEEIADSFESVDKAYAIQAGREIRIMVKPDKVEDSSSINVAREIVRKIENELEYPGHIKVTVIRETRAVDYAK